MAEVRKKRPRSIVNGQWSMVNCVVAVLITAGLGLLGCGSSQPAKRNTDFLSKGDYGLAILDLRKQESSDPKDSAIKRDLGIAYFKTNQLDKAIQKLEQSKQINPKDQKTLFFLGCSYQAGEAYLKAAAAYRECAGLKIPPKFKKELFIRISEAEEMGFEREIGERLRSHGGVNGTVQPNSVAVLYFRNISDWHDLEPILKGLTELVIMDLSVIGILDVAPRQKLSALLKLRNLSTAQLYDQTKLTETGKLLGVRHVVAGGIERHGQTGVSLTAGLVDANTGNLNGDGASVTGSFSELLTLQKKLVFDLLEDMQIKLHENDYKKLNQLPTNSILAFIAFCKGIHFQDLHRFTESKRAFESALAQDPAFGLAKQKLAAIPEQRISDAELELLL